MGHNTVGACYEVREGGHIGLERNRADDNHDATRGEGGKRETWSGACFSVCKDPFTIYQAASWTLYCTSGLLLLLLGLQTGSSRSSLHCN